MKDNNADIERMLFYEGHKRQEQIAAIEETQEILKKRKAELQKDREWCLKYEPEIQRLNNAIAVGDNVLRALRK